MRGRQRLLLDTHVAIWWLGDSPELPVHLKELIDTETEVYLSAMSVWEVAIKVKLGKLGPADLAERMSGCELELLPFTAEHAIVAGDLPLLHNDPFDRALIAQARVEDLQLLTRDGNIHTYPDVRLLKA
ncbi:type II toxin-antitoxin system VapC family toxin [Acrocarpospora sp. B8E8]|uniref:type II toxin-antitoxin system VapC family toxin n=1 Tax=Acrocarpospora sp. B8E8 TaxID=3153572 RepID=UPI00325EF239